MNNKCSNMYYRCFVYSAEEEKLRIKINGDDAVFGTVYVRGVPKRYTSIVKNFSDSKPDSIKLIEGDIRKIKYIQPKPVIY